MIHVNSFNENNILIHSRGYSVRTVTRLRSGRPESDSQHGLGPRYQSKPALVPTQICIQWVTGDLSRG